MESLIKWVVLGIGLAGIIPLAVMARSGGEPRRPASELGRSGEFAALYVVLGTVVLFLLTIPSEPPVFAPGMRMGYGILIGGLLGALAGVLSARAYSGTPWSRSITACGVTCTAILGVGLILTLFSSYPQPALGGFLIGGVLSAVIFKLVNRESSIIAVWALSSIILGAATLISTFRFNTIDTRFWWFAPSLLLSAAVLSTVIFSIFAKEDRYFSLHTGLSALVTLALTAVFAWKIFPQWELLWTAIIGIVTFALVAWLGKLSSVSLRGSAMSAILIVAFSACAFKLLAGFGIGIGILAAWAILLPIVSAKPFEESQARIVQTLIYGLYIGAGLLLLRLFLETYEPFLRGPDLRAYYTFVALAFGAMLPFVFASFVPATRPPLRFTAGAVMLVFLAAALPAVIVVVWGLKAGMGFLIGTLISQLIILLLGGDIAGITQAAYMNTAIIAVAAQVAAIQFSGLAATFNEGPRMVKILVIVGAAVLGLICVAVASTRTQPAGEVA